MAARLYARSGYAICQHRIITPGRRPQIKALHTEEQIQPFPSPRHSYTHAEGRTWTRPRDTINLEDKPHEEWIGSQDNGPTLSAEATAHQLSLETAVDAVRAAVIDDGKRRTGRERQRLAILGELEEEEATRLRRTEPESDLLSRAKARGLLPPEIDTANHEVRFPLNGQPLPHDQFRKAVTAARSTRMQKPIRRIMAAQLFRCQRPNHILKVVAVAMLREDTARELAFVHESIGRAIYRCRPNVSDQQALQTINVIINRFKMENLNIDRSLWETGLIFAARARVLPAVKKYLKEFKERGLRISSRLFKLLIAKFSVGEKGLGEIRNGRWQRRELLQILLGFEDAIPGQEYHLKTFRRTESWDYLHAWITVLSRCRANDELWKEWNLWLENPARTSPKELHGMGHNFTSRVRGDYWFLENMCFAGDLSKAWQIFKTSEIPFAWLRPKAKLMLLDAPELIPEWTEEIRNAMMAKYHLEINKLEQALGLTWVPGEIEEAGHHVISEDFEEEIMEKLSDPKLLTDPGPGFPWDEDPMQEEKDRIMNDAEVVVDGADEAVTDPEP